MCQIGIESKAVFSPCRSYRYRLDRSWSDGGLVNFVMLNPSTADEFANDPTVERCQRRAFDWGYGGLIVTNLFALRSTDPAALPLSLSPIGPANDKWIAEAAREAALIVCAWGPKGALLERNSGVLAILRECGQPHALRITKGGHPEHPLYVPYAFRPAPMAA